MNFCRYCGKKGEDLVVTVRIAGGGMQCDGCRREDDDMWAEIDELNRRGVSPPRFRGWPRRS